MANPEDLYILKQGAEVWNKYRKEHFKERPDLVHANLRRSDLRGIHLSGANLSGVDLTGARLTGARLLGASLTGARLTGVDFNRANLSHSSLRGADLTGANLRGVILNSAVVGFTVFADNDLSTVRGLDTVMHYGPSSIGIDTIYESRGSITEVFLRGCGVPEDFITYMRSLTAQPVQFYSCFISYSSKDHDFAERLHADLKSKGVRCWFAPEDLKVGDRFRDKIDESIRLHDKLLIVLSENSVSSPWVGDEVESAIEREHREGRTVLFPIKIDDAVTGSTQAWAATIRRTRHIGDFTRWKDHDSYSKAFDRLSRDLKAEDLA